MEPLWASLEIPLAICLSTILVVLTHLLKTSSSSHRYNLIVFDQIKLSPVLSYSVLCNIMLFVPCLVQEIVLQAGFDPTLNTSVEAV